MDMTVEEIIEIFRNLGSPFIADGMQRLGLPRRIVDPSLRPLIPNKSIAGTVVTILLDYYPEEPTPREFAFANAFKQAKTVASPVLVAESRLGLRSPFGGGASRSFVHAGLTGVIIDGPIRDIVDVTKQGMQMFHRTISADSFVIPKLPEGYVGAESEVAVNVGGVIAQPGELVVADVDGIVFCPVKDAPAVIAAAREILAEEEAIFKKWDAGQDYLQGLGLNDKQ